MTDWGNGIPGIKIIIVGRRTWLEFTLRLECLEDMCYFIEGEAKDES